MSNHVREISFGRVLMVPAVSEDTFNGHQTVEWCAEEEGINHGINALQPIVVC